MKLALIGGGGVRSPEFVRGVLAFAADLDLQELWLMDVAEERMNIIKPVCDQVMEQAGQPFALHATTNLDEALRNASVIVTSMRVGFEQGRIFDERIALRHGVLGQETTGPGGFSMAMRSIPALLKILERAEQLAPRAWTFNFTNPAGIVTQALRDSGFNRVVGICDSANTSQHVIADWLNLPHSAVKTEVFGLNHLSWTSRVMVNGRNVLPGLLDTQEFIDSTHLRFFGTETVQRLGLFLNEYLYYFYHRDEALQRIQDEERTRGEEIKMLNDDLFKKLKSMPDNQLLAQYEAYNRRRSASYMAYAESDEDLREERSNPTANTKLVHEMQDDVGGYAGVALKTALALLKDRPLRIGLNIPNEGALPNMRFDDVVEVSCLVDGRGVQPVHVRAIPEDADLLMRTVKRYERLAVQAILNRDRELAVDALVAHPLVGSYPLARMLVNHYLEAHKDFVGDWA